MKKPDAALVWAARVKKREHLPRLKISIFMLTVLTLVIILGSIMYLVEGPENGFTNIPLSIYWAIVTITSGVRD